MKDNPIFKKIFTDINGPLIGTAQDHLPIIDIVDGMVIFKDGGAAMVLESTSLNFGLLSDREQEAVIAAYAAFINSLSFAAQIVIRTQKKDITRYMNYLQKKAVEIKSEKLRKLFDSYIAFVVETTKKRNVLGKRFFIVIPFSPFELGAKSSMSTFVQTKKTTLPYTKDYVVKKAKVALGPKKDHLSRQAARVGLRLKQLDTVELTKLFYDIYNPNVESVKPSEEESNMETSQKGEVKTTGQQATQHIAHEGYGIPTQ